MFNLLLKKDKIIQAVLKCQRLSLLLLLGSSLVFFSSCKNKYMEKKIYIDTGFTINYLVKIHNGYILIDTSSHDSYDDFLEKLKKLNIHLSEIKYCFLTHHHFDHSGFVNQLMKNSNVEIITHKNSIPLLKTEKPLNKMKPLNFCTKTAFTLYALFSNYKERKVPVVYMRLKDYIVSDDDEKMMKSIGVDGQILHTPGHTDDSITLLMNDGSAFVGDLSMNILNLCGCDYRPIFADNMDTVFESWKKLIKKGAKVIYPSHGDPFDVKELIAVLKKYKKM